MRRKFLCGLAAILWARGLSAQPVPARELWEFPLGAVLEPAALAAEPGAGFWNPAASVLPRGDRWRFGVASLTTATEVFASSCRSRYMRKKPDSLCLAMSRSSSWS